MWPKYSLMNWHCADKSGIILIHQYCADETT